jgi:hypothetical protein
MGQTAYTALTDIDTAIYVSESLPTNNFGNADLTINTDGASYDHDGDGSPSNPSNDERVGLTKFTIQQPSFYGVPDDATLVGLVLSVVPRFPDSGNTSGQIQFWKIKDTYRNWLKGDGSSGSGATWNLWSANSADTWDPTFASAAIYDGTFSEKKTLSGSSAIELDCAIGLESNPDITWGSEINLAAYAMNDKYFGIDSDAFKYKIQWSKPASIPPVIEMVGNGTSGVIQQKTLTPDTTTNKLYIMSGTSSGLSAATSGSHKFSTTNYALSDIPTTSLSGTQIQTSGQGNTNYYYRAFVAGDVNTDAYAAGSNEIVIARPKVQTIAFSGFTNVGSTGTMTVTAHTGGAWSTNGSGIIKYLYVNWDGAASGEKIEDAAKIEYSDVTNVVTRTHTYTSSGAKNVWVAVEDTYGFRSTYAKAGSNPSPNAKSPTAVITTSKRTTLDNTDGLLDEVNTLSAIRSVAGDSGSQIYHYKWTHPAGAAKVTFHCNDNKNSSLEEQSRLLTVRCNWGADSSASKSNADAVLTVWGMGSFTIDGNPIADDHATFSHYKYCKDTLSPPDASWTDASATDSGSNGKYSTNYFKRVDMILVTTASSNDDANYPAFYEIRSKDSDNVIINPRISQTLNTFRASGWAAADLANPTINKGTNKITRASGNFLEDGFHNHDIVYMSPSSSTSLAGIYRISEVTPLEITFSDDIDGSGTVTEATKLRVDGRTLAAVTYGTDSGDANYTVSFTLAVSQVREPAVTHSSSDWGTAAVNNYVRRKTTLDLDTLADGNEIAISNVKYSRAGGLAPKMTLGDRIYPIGSIRTTQGLPTIDLTLTALSQYGLRKIFSLAEGITYDYSYLKSKRIDDPTLPIRTFIVKVMSISLDRSPDKNKFYSANVKFVIVGESV